jgi:hypothetical protein
VRWEGHFHRCVLRRLPIDISSVLVIAELLIIDSDLGLLLHVLLRLDYGQQRAETLVLDDCCGVDRKRGVFWPSVEAVVM